MRKIKFSDVAPHLLAMAVFLVVTVMFFSPFFFENKILNQSDITQFVWGSKELREFRDATGEEGLWAGTVFSGMPAYLVNLDWSDDVVIGIKKVLSLFITHPVCNIFLAFVSYYIMMLAFRVRPYLAIAAALAFGLSSFMIIGLGAGHNSRIGAIAFMPLVIAGIHLAFTNKRILGLGVTAAGLSLQLRESHPQVTYYLLMIVGIYGIVQLMYAWREKQLVEFGKTIGVLVIAVVVAAGTFFGPLWAIQEFGKYSTRGESELKTTSSNTSGSGLPKSYAFEYSNGIFEPITILIPNFYGGSSSHAFVNDQDSKTYQVLVNLPNQNLANQLAQYSSSYWGDQRLSAPYYGGAIIIFLFVLGCMIAEKKYVVWLIPVTVIGVMMSWGSNFAGFNYFLFDYLPGYNKFRSVTFVMVVVFFAVPLLGMLGLERALALGLDKKDVKRKLLFAFGWTGGLCLLIYLFAGFLGYTRSFENDLPIQFLKALQDDRESMLRSDALRSFAFIFSIFILLFLNIPKKMWPVGFFIFLIAMTAIDLSVVDKRYFTKDSFQRKRDNSRFTPTPADQAILKDKSYYRVLNFNFYEAATSQFHHSLGGYNGVRLKRYQELFDSCISREMDQLQAVAAQGSAAFTKLNVLNMLNTKYIVSSSDPDNFIQNPSSNGNAWFVKDVSFVKSANEELTETSETNTRWTAVIDETKFKLGKVPSTFDSLASITFIEQIPYRQKFESQSESDGLAVFSEIYYPKGWHATIDGKEVPILRADYVLRALEIPAGEHVIEFKFEPKPYIVGNKITMASGWVLLVLVLGSLGWSLKEPEN